MFENWVIDDENPSDYQNKLLKKSQTGKSTKSSYQMYKEKQKTEK